MTERHVQWETPFSFYGTGSSWDEEEVRLSFINAEVVEVNDLNEHPMAASPYFNIPVSGVSTGPIVNTSYAGVLPALPVTTGQDTWTLKVTKVGILHRKDDTVEGGRRAPSRRWREWTVMLTGSQLLFFRDLAWARSFLSQEEGVEAPSSLLRPDELLSVKDAVAVYDRTYHKVLLIRAGLGLPSAHPTLSVHKLPSLRYGQWAEHLSPRIGRRGDERLDSADQLRQRLQDGRRAHAAVRHEQAGHRAHRHCCGGVAHQEHTPTIAFTADPTLGCRESAGACARSGAAVARAREAAPVL
jgi:hypothetical protein